MKESIGATYIFAICMTFIVLFTGYLAISVNYSKAFRIKSEIVTEIEENKGYNGIEEKVKTYLTSQGYSAYGDCPNTIKVTDADKISGPIDTGWSRVSCLNDAAPNDKCNACIYKITVEYEKNKGIDDICAKKEYYKVLTFFKFDIPIVNSLLTFQVSGDSKYIIGDNTCS